MLAWTARLLFFALAFTLDVKVRAAEIVNLPNARPVLQEPENCLNVGDTCTVRTKADEKFKFPIGSDVVVLMNDSAALRASENEVTLLAGTIWIQAEGPFRVHTLFGDIVSEEGNFWVRTEGKKIWVTATSGLLVLQPRGSSNQVTDLRLEFAEENWMGPVGPAGVSATGVPTVMNFAEHILRWSKVFPGTRKQFTKEVAEFRPKWADAVKVIAKFHEDLALRKLASIDDQAARELQRKRAIENKNSQLRSLFRRKNTED